MSTKGSDNAFPLDYGQGTREQGLSKREYFAGLAMQGILANPSITGASDDTVVRDAVTMADKLLKQLNS